MFYKENALDHSRAFVLVSLNKIDINALSFFKSCVLSS